MSGRLLAIETIAGRGRRTLAMQLWNIVHFSGNDGRLVRAAERAVLVIAVQHPPGQGLGKILLVTGLTGSLHHGRVLKFGA